MGRMMKEKRRMAGWALITMVIVLLSFTREVKGFERYVESENGTDVGDCLTEETACGTIGYAFNKAGNGDTILIEGEFTLTETLYVSKLVNISSWYFDKPATVHCGEAALTGFSLLTSSSLHNFRVDSCSHRAVYLYLQNSNQMDGVLNYMLLTDNRQGVVVYESGIYERKVRIENSIIKNNVAEGVELVNGCGISSSQSVLLLVNVTVENNRCNGNGGGLFTVGGQIYTEKGVVINGNKGKTGGGWYGEMAQIYVSESSINDNTAVEYGGGLYLSSCQMEVYTSAGNNNKAGSSGGFAYILFGGWNSTHCSFDGNEVEVLNGGGLYAYQATIWMVNSTWSNNQSPSMGGGLYVDGSTTMLNLTSFHHNKGEVGGGIYAITGSVMMWANEFLYNEAIKEGGAIFALTSTPIMWNSTVHYNYAVKGGAFYMAGSSFVVYNTTCVENHSFGHQSAAVAYQDGSTLVFTNVTFIDNAVYVGEAGGVIEEEQEDIVCIHSSINIYDLDLLVSQMPVIVCLLQCEAVFIWGEVQDWICYQ